MANQYGKDEKGRFAVGNEWGRHNQPKTRLIQNAFLEVFTPEAMKEVAQRHLNLIRTAEGRTLVLALELLYNRCFGKPKESIDLSVAASASPRDLYNLSDQQLGQILTILEDQQQGTIVAVEALSGPNSGQDKP